MALALESALERPAVPALAGGSRRAPPPDPGGARHRALRRGRVGGGGPVPDFPDGIPRRAAPALRGSRDERAHLRDRRAALRRMVPEPRRREPVLRAGRPRPVSPAVRPCRHPGSARRCRDPLSVPPGPMEPRSGPPTSRPAPRSGPSPARSITGASSAIACMPAAPDRRFGARTSTTGPGISCRPPSPSSGTTCSRCTVCRRPGRRRPREWLCRWTWSSGPPPLRRALGPSALPPRRGHISPAMSEPPDTLAEALAGRYAFERELGRGGMATVYLAKDRKHDRHVAIKVLHPSLASLIGTDRFLREIRIAAGLTHPNILPLLDSGEAGGLLYYVTPHVSGGSLRDRLRQGGRLSGGGGHSHRRRDRRGARLRQPAGNPPPRREARECPVRRWARGARRFRDRPRPARRRHPRRDLGGRGDPGDARIHEPGAGRGRAGLERPERHLQPRLRGVRTAGGRAPARGHRGPCHDHEADHRDPASRPYHPSRGPGLDGAGAGAGPGQGAAGSLRDGGGVRHRARGPGARWRGDERPGNDPSGHRRPAPDQRQLRSRERVPE